MTRIHWQLLVASICILVPSIALPQSSPINVTVANLSLHAREMDGKLVRVRARVEVGWEGDNFLVDPVDAVAQKGKSSNPRARLWIYCDPRYAHQVCDPVFAASASRGHEGALGTFIGYFHFAPDTKSQTKGVFQTEALQFSATSVSDVVQQGR
jgi:hypothetical protein